MPKNNLFQFIYLIFGEPQISDRDRVLLTSFNQWRKYKNFPIRILIDFFIVFFLTAQALMLSAEFISYNNSNQGTFQTIFYPEEFRDGIYSIDDFLFVIENTVQNYYKFPLQAVNRYKHLVDSNGAIKPIDMTVKRYQSLDGVFWNFTSDWNENYIDDEDFHGDFDEVYNEFNITWDNPIGIFNESHSGALDRRSLIYYITSVELKFSFMSVNIGTLAVLPFIWDIYSKFSFSGGRIDFDLSVTYRINHTTGISGYDIFTSMTMILIILSVLSIFKSIQEIVYCRRVYLRVKGKYIYLSRISTVSDHYPNWESIPFQVKLAFFSFWTSLHILGCFCIAFASILNVVGMFGFSTSSAFYIVYGIGSMLACFNILRYFEYNKMLFLHISTLRNAVMHILRFLMSVFPIFWAYVIFGVLNFGPYSWKFSNLDQASVTLFALLTGDDIHDTFYDLAEGGYPIVAISRIYIYTFVVVFITSVLNVFIFIIQDAYVTARIALGIDPPPASSESSNQSPSLEQILVIIFDNLDQWALRMMESTNFQSHLPHHHLLDDELSGHHCDDEIMGDDIHALLSANSSLLQPHSVHSLLAPNLNNIIALTDIAPAEDIAEEEGGREEGGRGGEGRRKEKKKEKKEGKERKKEEGEMTSAVEGADSPSMKSISAGGKGRKRDDVELEKLFRFHQRKFMEEVETKIKEAQLHFSMQLQQDLLKLLHSRPSPP